ncbi:MAG: transcriptional regulator, partial [Chitinophagaceae bacterium]
MNNTRFATVIHILTLLAKSRDQWLSSDRIANSISINPV